MYSQFPVKNYVVIIFLTIIICNFSVYFHQTYGQVKFGERVINKGTINPVVLDSLLKVEVVAEDLDTPTTMAFLAPNDFLILEKDKGTVQRVINGQTLDRPLLDVNVANSVERGSVVLQFPQSVRRHMYSSILQK